MVCMEMTAADSPTRHYVGQTGCRSASLSMCSCLRVANAFSLGSIANLPCPGHPVIRHSQWCEDGKNVCVQ